VESRTEAVVEQQRLRFTQAVVAITALAAFVFKTPIVNPLLAATVLLTFGPRPLDLLASPYDRWLAPRVRRADHEPIARARLVGLTSVILLGASGFCWIVGAIGIAELLGLVGSASAALYATTGIEVVANAVGVVRRARHRNRRRAASGRVNDDSR
jgi:hypothetical protein